MWAKNVRYLDYNATSGITGSVRKKLTEILSQSDFYFANPSSQHRAGQQSQALLLRSMMKIASSLGANTDVRELVFTSSGTEANQTVIRSAFQHADLILIGAGEHSASFDMLAEVPAGKRSAEVPLQTNGQYDLAALSSILDEAKQSGAKKIFLSLFWANNETGVVTNLKELDGVLRASGLAVTLHLDGAQVWGKQDIAVHSTPAHFITFSSHKIGAPAGGGLIWSRDGAGSGAIADRANASASSVGFFTLEPMMAGLQMNGLRGGTENLLGIAGMAFAVEEMNPAEFTARTEKLRSKLEAGLQALGMKVWAQGTERISNTSRFSIPGFKNYENWVQLFDLRGFAVSHGSACKSKIVEPSRVLLKMGASESEALNAIRISLGPSSEEADIEEFLMAFQAILSEKNRH